MILFLKGCLLILDIDKIVDYKQKEIINSLINRGFEVCIVGGAIRDYYLNNKIKDIDLEVYCLSFDILKETLSNLDCFINDKFQTIKINNLEITLPRIEKKVGLNYLDYQLTFKKDLPKKIAASRRDFTINSLIYSINDNILYDFFDGMSDLNNKILKMTNKISYQEDSIRILRLLDYQSRYNFSIEINTLNYSKEIASYLWAQDSKMVATYLKRIITNEYFNVDYFFEVLKPFLMKDSLVNRVSNNIHHPEKTLFNHLKGALICLNLVDGITKKDYFIIFVALLFHDFGKLVFSKDHVINSLAFFEIYQDYFLIKNKEKKLVYNLISDHMNFREYVGSTTKMIELKKKYRNQFYLLEIVGTCDFAGRVLDFDITTFKERIKIYNKEVLEKYRRL